MNDSLIILAAGLSSRMKKSKSSNILSDTILNQANNVEKGLIGVDKKGNPLIHYLLVNALHAGFENIYLVVGEKSSNFRNYFRNNIYEGLNIQFATQFIENDRIKPSGTADAVYQTLVQYPKLKNLNFCVCNSDNLYSKKALSKIRTTKALNAFISYDRKCLKFNSEKISSFSVLKLNKENYLLDILEKPSKLDLNNFKDYNGVSRVNMNLFKFNGSTFFKFLKDCPFDPVRNEKELPTAVLNISKNIPNSVLGIPHCEHVPDLTSKDDISLLLNSF